MDMNTKYLCATKYDIEDFIARNHESTAPLKIRILPNGIVQALDNDYKNFGVMDRHGRPAVKNNDIRQAIGNRTRYAPDSKTLKDIDYMDEDVVYMGGFQTHFGHFMVDSLPGAWLYLDKRFKDKKCVFIDAEGVNKDFLIFLELLGVKKKNIIFLKKSTRFKNVIVPDVSMKKGRFANKKFIETAFKIADKVPAENIKKIYFSRQSFEARGRAIFGEEKIQKIFAKNGYKVVFPETLSISEQIALVKGATHIAGLAGSALHLSMFSKNAQVICINRAKGFFLFRQVLIDSMRQKPTLFIDASIELFETQSHKNLQPKMVACNKNVLRYFDDHKFKYSEKDIRVDKAEFNDYLIAAALYESENLTGSKPYRNYKLKKIINDAKWFVQKIGLKQKVVY